MMNDPWRPQDIGDSMLQRSTREHPPIPFENGEPLDVEALGVVADEVYFTWQPRSVVFWPMVLHRHDQDCNRA